MDRRLGQHPVSTVVVENISNPLSANIQKLKLDTNLQLKPVHALIITRDGPLSMYIENAQESFGRDPPTQVIGLTICALAHVCGGPAAVIPVHEIPCA